MRWLSIVASVVALTVFVFDGSQSLVSAQMVATRPTPAPPLGTFAATRTLLDAAPAWRVDAGTRERAGFRMHVHDRHWSWLFPRTAVAPFGSDPLQRRHWWADPLLRRHWWE